VSYCNTRRKTHQWSSVEGIEVTLVNNKIPPVALRELGLQKRRKGGSTKWEESAGGSGTWRSKQTKIAFTILKIHLTRMAIHMGMRER
jgi:hypothetical protein